MARRHAFSLSALLIAVLAGISVAGDRDVAELLFGKAEKAYKRKQYEDAAGYYRRALDETSPYPQAAFGLGQSLEKLGRAQDAIRAYLRCCDELEAVESPKRAQRRMLDRARKAVNKLGAGYSELAAIDKEFVKKLTEFGRRYMRSSPEWARRAYGNALAIDPESRAAKTGLERLEEVGEATSGMGLYKPLIRDDGLSNWDPGRKDPWTCRGKVIRIDTPSPAGKVANVKMRLEGTYRLRGTFRCLDDGGRRRSWGLFFGKQPEGGWALIIDWDLQSSIVRFGSDKPSAEGYELLSHFDPKSWHVLEVAVEPGRITCYLNGEEKLVHTASAESFGGSPGLFMQDGKFEAKELGVKR